MGLGHRWSLVRGVSWAHGFTPWLPSLLTDQGRGGLDALIHPSSHSGPNATCPHPPHPRLGEELGSQGAGRQLPHSCSPFGCENQLLLGWNVPCSWNSLSFPEASDGHIYALLSIIAQEDPGASVWQLQGPGDSGWGPCWVPLLGGRPHVPVPGSPHLLKGG